MAIKTQSQNKAHIKKPLLGAFCLGLIASCILYFWALFIWVGEGFETACLKVSRLAFMQNNAIEEFKDFSFYKLIRAQIMPKLSESSIYKQQIHNFSKETTQQVMHQWHVLFNAQTSYNVSFFNELKIKINEAWCLLLATENVFLLKLTILISSLPLFTLAVMAGLVDGLNQRAIRTACLGRESTYLFHRIIPVIKKGIFLLLIFWLSLPLPIYPSVMFAAMAVMLSLLVSMTASRFKKYL